MFSAFQIKTPRQVPCNIVQPALVVFLNIFYNIYIIQIYKYTYSPSIMIFASLAEYGIQLKYYVLLFCTLYSPLRPPPPHKPDQSKQMLYNAPVREEYDEGS